MLHLIGNILICGNDQRPLAAGGCDQVGIK